MDTLDDVLEAVDAELAVLELVNDAVLEVEDVLLDVLVLDEDRDDVPELVLDDVDELLL